MPTPDGALYRAIADMTVGLVRSTRARDQRDLEMGLQEFEQQYQFAIAGTALPSWTWSTPIAIAFDLPFYFAPGQRDSDLDRPQFYYGAEVSPAVAVCAVVTGWALDADNGAIVGASVAVGVMGDSLSPTYTGAVHLTFQGYGGLAEDTDI